MSIEKYKTKLVKESKSSIVYIFYSPVIKREFEKLVLDTLYITAAINELLGYKIKNTDITALLKKRGDIIYSASKIIKHTKIYNFKFDIEFFIHTELDKKLHIINKFKEKCSVFSINSFEDKIICDALYRIDRFDSHFLNQKNLNWIETINNFKENMKSFIDTTFELFENRGVEDKDLINYPSLKKRYKAYLKKS
jgi:hypothetical protein